MVEANILGRRSRNLQRHCHWLPYFSHLLDYIVCILRDRSSDSPDTAESPKSLLQPLLPPRSSKTSCNHRPLPPSIHPPKTVKHSIFPLLHARRRAEKLV
ncbi:uncharacterized protein TrAtP1_003237 [Trichoderma atroviride]|uniref:uncharacterized protein n=1 Tax=Hypocrea atroviridis TaxID=63577 RepID=UPI003320F129|nr:hypothetical protein TrAtP1_003237 [Trichoderma atroviride]